MRDDVYTTADTIRDRAEYVRERVFADDHMGALRQLGVMAREFTELAGDLAQEAYNAGQSKAAIARALDVTPATFRGMVRA